MALIVAAAGGIYLFLFGGRLLGGAASEEAPEPLPAKAAQAAGDDPSLVAVNRDF